MRYEIWSEAAYITGGTVPVQRMGVAEGETFIAACRSYFVPRRDVNYDADKNTYWACKLYPTREEAEGK